MAREIDMARVFVVGLAALLFSATAFAADTISSVVPCSNSPQPGISVGRKTTQSDLRNPWRYPAQARRNREQGTVTLKLWLDERGDAQRVSLVAGSGSSQLDRFATRAAKVVRFCSMQRDTPAGAGVAIVHVTYSLRQTVAQL